VREVGVPQPKVGVKRGRQVIYDDSEEDEEEVRNSKCVKLAHLLSQ
jgi:hypothetical protein